MKFAKAFERDDGFDKNVTKLVPYNDSAKRILAND